MTERVETLEGPNAAKPEGNRIGLLRQLIFRFGFVVQRIGEKNAELLEKLRDANWGSLLSGDYLVCTHPEVRVEVFRTGGLSIVIIGDAFVETGEALGEVLARVSETDESSLFALLNELGGRFALLAIDGDWLRAFHDPIASRSVYYHSRNPLGISSHIELLAAAINADKCPDIADYMADRVYRARRVKYLPGDRTIYRSILALPPNMLFDSRSLSTRRYWPIQQLRPSNISDFQDIALNSLGALANYFKDRYKPILGFTGGVDSRAVLAAFRRTGIEVEPITWNRSGLISGESEIIDRLTSELGIKHEYLPKPDRAGQIGRLAGFNDGGAFLTSSRLCAALRKRYKNRNDVVLVRGWGGEIARGCYNRRIHPMKSSDPSEMARMYLAVRDGGGELVSVTPEFRSKTESYFAEFAERGRYADIMNLGYDHNDIFYWEHRIGMWSSAANNEIDAAMFSVIAYNSRRLFTSAFGLTSRQRLNKKLLLGVAAKCDNIYSSVPITDPTDSTRNRVRGLARWLVLRKRRYT